MIDFAATATETELRPSRLGDQFNPVTSTVISPDTEPKEFAAPATRLPSWSLPIVLGILYAFANVLLVVVELAQPTWSLAFKGIRFSNAINSSGARESVALYREHLDWLPRPWSESNLSTFGYLTGLRIAWISMFALQFGAVLACRRARTTSPWIWSIGPALASIVLIFYPPTSTDIYAYSSFGWVAEHGGNPYVDVPRSMPGDPFGRFNDWTHITTPYGPIWSWLSRGLVTLAGDDPYITALYFKIVATVCAFGLAWVTWHLARRFTDDPRLTLTAFVLVLWSPILITESAGPVHFDSVMMLFAMLGLLVATGTKIEPFRLGLLFGVASIMVKPATLPLVGLMALMRFAHSDRIGVVLRRLVWDAVASIAMLAVGLSFYWEGGFASAANKMAHVVFIDRPMRSNPFWAWGLSHLDALIGVSDLFHVRPGVFSRWLTIALAAAVTIFVIRALRRQRRMAAMDAAEDSAQATLRFLIWAWAAVTMALSILPLNGHPWYVIWSMTPLAILWITDGRHIRLRPPVWLLSVQLWVMVSFMVYHTLPKR